MNWGECKLAALKKLDPAVTSLAETRNTKDYLNAMIDVANRGLYDLSSAGKFLIGHEFLIKPAAVPDACSTLGETIYFEGDNVTYECIGGKSYYLEMAGNGRAEIYVNGILVKTILNTSTLITSYKGNVANTSDSKMEIVMTGTTEYYFRNVAIYKITYTSDAAVPDYSELSFIDLRELIPDFYRILNANEYDMDGDFTLVIRGTSERKFDISYYKYPEKITEATLDSYELPLDPEVALLLPVYMASELAEDDDTSVAYYFRQQYDQAKSQLSMNNNNYRTTVEDVWGW